MTRQAGESEYHSDVHGEERKLVRLPVGVVILRAEAGRFEDAVRTAQQALERARETNPALAEPIGWRLGLYRRGLPFRMGE